MRILGRWTQMKTDIAALRIALADAVSRCPECKGYGKTAIPGGWRICHICARWRKVLTETRP